MNFISKILAPMDYSEASIDALNYSIKIGKTHHAKSQKSNIIVMGIYSRSGLMYVLKGSIAEKIVRYSPVPKV